LCAGERNAGCEQKKERTTFKKGEKEASKRVQEKNLFATKGERTKKKKQKKKKKKKAHPGPMVKKRRGGKASVERRK